MIGEVVYNKVGAKCTIIEWCAYTNVAVLFEDGYVKHTSYANFKNGYVNNPYTHSVWGKGYMGEGNYSSSNKVKGHSLQYRYWKGLLQRVYSNSYLEKFPTYKGCKVCDDWHNFQNFGKWFDENYYKIEDEKMCLDKDILAKGNKIYSPETCVFVPNRINCLFVKSNASRGDYPIGVNFRKDKNMFEARCSVVRKRISLGLCKTPTEAFTRYKVFKEKYIKQVADDYKERIPKKLYDAMYNYKVEIGD